MSSSTSKTHSKRIEICGHWVEFSFTLQNKVSSNFSSIIFNNQTYFKNICLYLSLFDNLKFKLISNYYNDLYNDVKNNHFIKQLVSYDYGPKIVKFQRVLDYKKMYCCFLYL